MPGRNCNGVYRSLVSPDGKYAAFELWSQGDFDALYVYFASVKNWARIHQFGAASVRDIDFYSDGLLVVGLEYSESQPNWKVSLPKIENDFSAVVDPITHELSRRDTAGHDFVEYANSTGHLLGKSYDLVKALPEVQEWLALFSGPDGISPTTGGRPEFESNRQDDGTYSVRVYEFVPADGHIATFNWYTVNPTAGTVERLSLPDLTSNQ